MALSDNLTTSDAVSVSVLASKFTAIEEGTVEHQKLRLVNTAPPSGAVASAVQIYSKDVTVGMNTIAELHARDEDNNEIQLTSAGSMGSASTDIGFSTLSHDSGTTSYDQYNLVTAWGHFTSTGANLNAVTSQGLTCAKDATGEYTVTFDTNAASANYGVIATAVSTDDRVCIAHTLTTSTFKISIRGNQNSNARDSAFTVMVLGGRV